MQIARYWALGKAEARTADGQLREITCWRWSAGSQAEAQQRADAAARDAAGRAAAGQALRQGYGYLDRPPREEIVQEFRDDAGQTFATLTRNAYGALILNTRDLMFIDVDRPIESPGQQWMRGLKRLLGRRVEDPARLIRQRLAETASPDDTVRLYETCAGFRCALVNRPILPGTPESDELLARFDADPLYVRLCQNQQSYRVRLTPKFWRCGAPRPPHRFPWQNQQQEEQVRQWQAEYEQQAAHYATCRFLQQFGRHPAPRQMQLLVELHDRITRVDADPARIEGLA